MGFCADGIFFIFLFLFFVISSFWDVWGLLLLTTSSFQYNSVVSSSLFTVQIHWKYDGRKMGNQEFYETNFKEMKNAFGIFGVVCGMLVYVVHSLLENCVISVVQ